MMADNTSSSRQKISRASGPKVKSGCVTCKKRRVKCDETKPECLRCRNFGCACDGYEFPSRKVSRTMPRRVLIPRAQGAVQIQHRRSSSGLWNAPAVRGKQGGEGHQTHLIRYGSQQILDEQSLDEQSWEMVTYDQLQPDNSAPSAGTYAPSMTIFESEQESLYFRFYRDTTAHQLSGSFCDGTWRESFLQACHEEPFVRRAIIAIAALSKAMEAFQPRFKGVKALPDINDAFFQNPHHVFALQQYGKAVRQMRDAIKKRKEDVRVALMSCLLTVCFESFHGHHENAIGQIGAGLGIMHDWLKKQKTAKGMSGLKSPNPHVMDDELFHSFMRLDVAAMHFFDKRSGEFHREQSLEDLETVQCMPQSFDTLEQAGIYFGVVMKRVMHFFKWIESKAMEHRHHKQIRLGTTDIESIFPHQHVNVVLGPTLIELEGYLGELERWMYAFRTIADRSSAPEGQMETIPVAFLRLHHILLYLLLAGLKCPQEWHFDQFLPEFTEIVALAETILDHPYLAHSAGKAVFVFDPNIVLPLLVVTIKCRNWVIRRRAIELLRTNPRREGTWDSSLAAEIGIWHMHLEEKELRTGQFVPERNRVRMAGVKQDFSKRTALLSASQDIDGTTIMHETTVNW